MTATQRWMENVIKGGWMPVKDTWQEEYGYFVLDGYNRLNIKTKTGSLVSLSERDILIDPLAWQARALWLATKDGHAVSEPTIKLAARYDFNKTMDAIWDGRTIEEALKSLETN